MNKIKRLRWSYVYRTLDIDAPWFWKTDIKVLFLFERRICSIGNVNVFPFVTAVSVLGKLWCGIAVFSRYHVRYCGIRTPPPLHPLQQALIRKKRASNFGFMRSRCYFISKQEDARRRLRGMCWCKKELPVCWMAMESWVVYATNVCRRDGDVLLRNNTLEDELYTRVPLLLKTKLTSILPPYMLGV